MADFPVKVKDVVAVAMLGVDIPLDRMVSQTDEAEYEPEHSDGVVYKLTVPANAVGLGGHRVGDLLEERIGHSQHG